MAGGLGNHGSRGPDTWACNQSGVDCALQTEARAGHVAYARESSQQHIRSFFCGSQIDEGHIGGHQLAHGQRGHHDVIVGVNEPRH